MEELIGYDRQKDALIENTERLLRGLPASNVLLYGDSGTGKSSSVKALLNRYRGQGLKLIAVPKERIDDMGEILAHIAGRGLKFIVFIDDLSFEENDGSYKPFKSIIEGSVNGRQDNAMICVTSNRRNIVKEVWKDREGLEADDVHLRDNLQEKRSLADRFGLTLVFAAPDKASYLEIVSALADQAGLSVDQKTLLSGALTWGIRHGGRSGRTARQYIDHLIGAQALSKSNGC
jgi:predicted AAA+ superfamily ATPase